MTWAELLTAGGLIITLVLGLFNFFGGAARNKSIGMLERGQYLESVNKSVQLANERALEAEKRAIDWEDRANSIEDRMTSLEKSLSYRLTFDVVLGTRPIVDRVKIEHFPERRTAPFVLEEGKIDRRRKE